MKRIVKETLNNGKVQYRVESNKRFFGLITCNWYTCRIKIPNEYVELTKDAVFNSLEEAKKFCGINSNPIIKREIIEYNTSKSVLHPNNSAEDENVR